MRLVKIKLADSPFWFLGTLIKLNKKQHTSDLINVDRLPDEEKVIINKSASRGEIRIFDSEGNRLKTIESVAYVKGEYSVDVEDIEDDESDTVPEVFSATIANDNEEEEVEEDLGPTEADFDNAELLLSKNGNTVKKTIKSIAKTNEGLLLLHACLAIEKSGKNRAGILSIIEQSIMEF